MRLEFDVAVYARISEAKLPSLTKMADVDNGADGNVAPMKRKMEYVAEGEDGAELATVDKKDLQKVFIYGSDMVPVNDEGYAIFDEQVREMQYGSREY